MTLPPKPPNSLPLSERTKDPLRDEALAWIAHLHSGDETEADWASFDAWRKFDAAHAQAAQKAEKIWEQLGPALTQGRRRNSIISSILVAVVALSSLAFASGLFGPPATYFADFSTSVGEIRTVTLKDGSRVDLDTATSFDVDAEQRHIVLHTGRIFVQVAPDPSRPFSVSSGDTTVRALGTAFVVRRDGDATTVAVTEHAVSFSTQRDSLRVQAGNALTYSAAKGFEQTRTIDVDTVTSWRRGELAFGERPLSDVVKEIERYHRGKIIILGDAVGRLPVSGVFDVRDTDTLFASIELALPVQVIRLPGVAILRWNSSRAPPPRS